MCLRGGISKTIAFSLSLSRGTTHATSECQMEVRKNTVSKYHFALLYYPNALLLIYPSHGSYFINKSYIKMINNLIP